MILFRIFSVIKIQYYPFSFLLPSLLLSSFILFPHLGPYYPSFPYYPPPIYPQTLSPFPYYPQLTLSLNPIFLLPVLPLLILITSCIFNIPLSLLPPPTSIPKIYFPLLHITFYYSYFSTLFPSSYHIISPYPHNFLLIPLPLYYLILITLSLYPLLTLLSPSLFSYCPHPYFPSPSPQNSFSF